MRLLPIFLVAVLLAGCASTTTPTPGTPSSTIATPPTVSPSAGSSAGCAPGNATTTPTHASGTVTILTYNAFGLKKEDFSDFTNQTGYDVEIVTAGDAGEALTKAIVSKDQPVADVMFGVDNVLIYRAAENGIFQPYASPALSGVAEKLRSPFCYHGEQLATPLDYGYVELNYDTGYFAQHNLTLPTDLADIASTKYAPLTVVENPYTSSPGTAFLLATVARFGEANGTQNYQTWWANFRANGGKIDTDWDTAYGKDFTQGYDNTGKLDHPIVLSYSTSPAYNPMNGYGNATSANIDVAKGAWFQVEAMGILQHAKNVDGAKALIDFMLGKAFQEKMAFSQVEYPVLSAAKAPEAYAKDAPEPTDPATMDAATIEKGRDAWLQGWRDATGQ